VSASATATKLLSQFDTKRANDLCREALAAAGIVVGGSDPWDIVVHDDRFYQRLQCVRSPGRSANKQN